MKNAKQYFDELTKITTELQTKYDNTRNEQDSNPRAHFVKGQIRIEATKAQEKQLNFYNCLVKRVPEDKKQELNEYLKPLYYTGGNKEIKFKNKYGKLIEAGRYDFEFFPFNLMEGDKSEIIEKIASYIPEQDILDAIAENEQFVSADYQKVKVKLLDSQIGNVLESKLGSKLQVLKMIEEGELSGFI